MPYDRLPKKSQPANIYSLLECDDADADSTYSSAGSQSHEAHNKIQDPIPPEVQSRECDEETLIGDDDGEDEEQWQPTQKESVVVTSKPRVATPPKSTVASKPARSIPQTSPSKAPGVLSKPASPMPKNPHSKAPTVSNSPNVGPQTSSPRKTAAANGSPLRVQNQNSSKAATEPKSAAHAVLEKPAPPRSENPSSTKVEIRDGVIHRPRKREFERRKLPAQRLSADPNAGAVSAWREHKPSTLIYPLLRNFNPSSRKTDAIRTRTGTHFPMLEHIAAKTSTHLILSHKGRDFEVHIWGTDDDARSAVSWIEWWVKDMFGGTGRQRFDKVPSLSLEEWNIIEKKFVNEQRRQQFRRHPSENDRFAHKIHVRWPETGLTVQEVFEGMNFDALDEIRMDCLCHIRFVTHSLDPVPHPTFEVMGNNIDRIRDACGRLNGIIDQQDARQFGRPRWYLVKPCDTSELRATIKLEDYLSPKLLQRGQQESSPTTSVLAAVPRFSGPILTQGELEEREYRSEMIQVPGVCTGGSDVERLNLESLEATTMTTLEILTHYRGYLRMRASLGKFGLTSYPKGADGKPKIEYELDDFDNMLSTANRQESRMEGHVTKELGNPLFESTVLDRFKAASHLLLSNDVRSQKLADVKPFYSVTFVIASLNPDGNPFQLQLEFQDNGSKAERLNQRWLRLEPGERDFTPLMDINLADLEGGLSFHLGIAAAEAVAETRIPTHYRDFANNVKLDLRLARDYKGSDADSCFFSWPRKPNKQPTVPILGMTQKRAWIFMMKNSDYVAEVATVQNVVFDSDSVAAGPSIVDGRIEKATSGSGARPYEMRWAVQLWHQLWDMELPGNQDLGLGKKAKWRAEEWAFFPADKDEEAAKKSNGDEDVEDMFFYAGDGFRALMEKLKCLEGIVKGEELGNQGSEDEVSVTESTDTVGDDSDS